MSTVASKWTGASGAEYFYYIHDLDVDVPAGPGNYIYARTENEQDWLPVYVGEGDLAVCARAQPELMKCIEAKGATHLLLRRNSRTRDRASEVEDLLMRHGNAFAPGGCHADRLEGCMWFGKAEEGHIFYVYDKAELIPSRSGVFVCSRRTYDQIWAPLAVGQGDLSLDNPDIARWTGAPECTHIHRRLESSPVQAARLRDEIYENYAHAWPDLRRC